MEDSPPRIYLSYRSVARGIAKQLVTSLRESGVEVFADEDVPLGSRWPLALKEALNRASALLVLIDPSWLRHQDEWGRRKIDNPDDWVHQEVSNAIHRDLAILPVLVDGASMPPKAALPGELSSLSERQAARVKNDSLSKDVGPIVRWAKGLAQASKTRGKAANRMLRSAEPHELSSAAPALGRSECWLERLEIRDFRCIDEIEIRFDRESLLPGEWTCIVGLNGAGKTSILQALALLLMGPKHALELGGERLQAMRRRLPDGGLKTSVLRAWLEFDGHTHFLELTLDDQGPAGTAKNLTDPRPAGLWSHFEQLAFVGYGASRNLSDSSDRWDGTSEETLAFISLFDPMARLVRAKELLRSEGEGARSLFAQLVERVFSEEGVRVESAGARLQFSSSRSIVGAHDLADGFRSSVTWMAHFCARAAAVRPSARKLDELTGLVLVDEIDLHLHASLQRAVIPRLREALPGVQFIVTSHSPLIISSFDRHELVVLDAEAPDGKRQLDRQILGFSSDEVYSWLMETPPHSEALNRSMADSSPELAAVIHQTSAPGATEEKAREFMERQEAILARLGITDGMEV
ncbi:MAG: AAA family ATPase [Acidobacteriota bacterium]